MQAGELGSVRGRLQFWMSGQGGSKKMHLSRDIKKLREPPMHAFGGRAFQEVDKVNAKSLC